MALTVGCLLRGGRGEYRTIGTSVPPKKLRKKKHIPENMLLPLQYGIEKPHPMIFGEKYMKGIRFLKKICVNAKEKKRRGKKKIQVKRGK
jgi:hypothetical protein